MAECIIEHKTPYKYIREILKDMWVKAMKKYILSAAAMAVITLFLLKAQNAMDYARDAMNMCVETVIPTLFPFFICSGVLLYSGFCEALSVLFRPCMKPLFGVSPAGASAFVLGIISGYPLGAVTAGQLYENGYITKTEAERLTAFCNNSGPLFILGSVGAAVYGNIRLGIMLYVFHILAALTVGVIFRFYKRNDYTAPDTVMTTPNRSAPQIISIAVNNAVKTMLTVCGAVVFFGMTGRLILDLLPVDGKIYAVLSGVVEFVTGTMAVSKLDSDIAEKMVYTAFIVGFAGMSVHAQVISAVSGYGLDMRPYFAGKVMHGFIAALYTYIYLQIFPIVQTAFAPSMSRGFCVSSAHMVIAAGVLIGAAFAVRGRTKTG